MKKRILFIVNPISGVGRQRRIETLIERNLNLDRFDYEVRYTERIHHGTQLAREAVEEGGFDAIVAVGGDGSVNDVVNGIVGSGTANGGTASGTANGGTASGIVGSGITMGIIPCGSGNGLARNLKIPLTPALAIKLVNDFYVAPIDTVQLNDTYYVSIAGIGFDAQVARRMKLAKVRGFQAYANICVTDYPTSKNTLYRMTIDGREVERSAWFVSFANSNQFGYNTAIAPLARLDDGLIDVCIVDKIPLAHLPLTAPLVYMNHFEVSQHVEIFKAHEVIVHNNDAKWVNIDGEGESVGTELHFTNIPRSLNIICRRPQHLPNPKVLAKKAIRRIERDINEIKTTLIPNE